jgi:glycosyltransferase involved in cell wall biosynthesis
LGLEQRHRVALFFGQIAPYKGLAYLVEALPQLIANDANFRLVIAGKVKKGHEHYFDALRPTLEAHARSGHVLMRIEHIPDADLERYFKAADVLVMPYTEIFQSGVLFLAYSFGLPVIATEVGSLKRDIVEGRTGFVCKPRDAPDLARAIRAYFASPLHRDLARARGDIRTFASANNAWATNAAMTVDAYRRLVAAQ